MFGVRSSLDRAHVALIYLLVVLGSSSSGGRALGLALAVAGFLCFNFFFIPPYHTFEIGERLDWLVLFAFLITAAVAAHLLARARSEAHTARQRAAEIDRLSALGAETLNAGRADDALAAIAGVIRATLGVCRCEIHLRDQRDGEASIVVGDGEEPPRWTAQPAYAGAPLIEWVAVNGRPAMERADGTIRIAAPPDEGVTASLERLGARTLLIPLRVRDRTVGVLRIAHSVALTLNRADQRFIDVLSYYAALGAERVRLVAEAERADALQRADALKDALLASVSHDLRTPLTTIKALAHGMRVEGDDRAAIIEEEADRLNRFVADLLDLSRLSAGALGVRPELNAAEDLIGAALQRVGGSLHGRVLTTRLDANAELLLGRFDFVHSLRILVNVIENALKYSPPDTAIDVSVHRAGDALEFIVADRGAGVLPSERERIFEPFYRPSGTPPDAGGAGLGLSIARQLALAQNGTLEHDSREGGGSRFTLRLPYAELEQDAAPEAPKSL
jgi:two-component system sensor histidine kinase KdpD